MTPLTKKDLETALSRGSLQNVLPVNSNRAKRGRKLSDELMIKAAKKRARRAARMCKEGIPVVEEP